MPSMSILTAVLAASSAAFSALFCSLAASSAFTGSLGCLASAMLCTYWQLISRSKGPLNCGIFCPEFPRVERSTIGPEFCARIGNSCSFEPFWIDGSVRSMGTF